VCGVCVWCGVWVCVVWCGMCVCVCVRVDIEETVERSYE